MHHTSAQPKATLTQPPPHSRIATQLDGAHFYDAWSITTHNTGLSALAYFVSAAARTPRWVNWCMAARNTVGKRVGLKDLGTLSATNATKPDHAYLPGERVGIFTVIDNTPDEALVGDHDKHLNVVISIHRALHPDRQAVTITATTVVHIKNWLGHLYMLPVTPMHRLIVPAVLRNIHSAPTTVATP